MTGLRSASTVRWTVASFSAGIGLLALAAVVLVAALADGEALRRTLLAVGLVVGAAALLVVVALDLLGARSRRAGVRERAGREPPRSARPSSRRIIAPRRAGRLIPLEHLPPARPARRAALSRRLRDRPRRARP